MTVLAPIVLFVYNRPWHTRQTLEALAINTLANVSTLYIYADGPKPNATYEQKEKISKVRQLICEKQWCKEVFIIESSINKGLADSIIEGVTEILNKHGKIIVIEDDIVPNTGFLEFMNNALDIYETEEKVMQISAYIYPHKKMIPDKTYFLKIMSCWGWGTWKRAWEYYDHNIETHLMYFNTKDKIKKFDIEGHGFFYWQLLANQSNEIYTWAVRWYASWLKHGGYCLYPSMSLITNIGFDKTGENSKKENEILNTCTINEIEIYKQQPVENKKIRKSIDYSLYKQSKKKFLNPNNCILLKKAISFSKKLNLIFIKKLSWHLLQNNFCNSYINPKSYLQSVYKIYDSSIDKYSYIAKNSEIRNTTVGKFCSIGKNFTSGNGIHPLNGISTAPMFYSNEKQNGYTLTGRKKINEFLPVTIENDVFIGDNVTVLSGVKIGNGAVIGAGAVVSKDIPPYAIAVGCPIKIIRYRFNEQQIEALLKIKWWDFSEDKLKDVEKYFFEIDTFIKSHTQV